MRKTGTGSTSPAEALARHERVVVLTAVALIVLLAGLYTLFGIGMDMSAIEMTGMARPLGHPMSMGAPSGWTPQHAILIFLMWWVMMVAMMTPSAAPMLLLFAALKRAGPDAARAGLGTGMFLAGYLLCWGVFSTLAAALQWVAERAGGLEAGMMTLNSGMFAGGLLIAAGLYQFSTLKSACLTHCRTPAQFLTLHHRSGPFGALVMGAHHGMYCLGCCWALMLLLFAGGVMNLWWIVGLALYVLLEKLVPVGPTLARWAGGVLIAAGLYVAIPAP